MSTPSEIRDQWQSFRSLKEEVETCERAGREPPLGLRASFERLRNDLMLAHGQLLEHHVAGLARRLPRWVDRDDLRASGAVGLLEAIMAFDPARGVPFAAYSAQRIRGAMLDELRCATWLPPRLRAAARRLTQAEDSLKAELGRPPAPAEVAARLGLSLADYEVIRARARRRMVSYDAPAGPAAEPEVARIAQIPDRHCADPVQEALRQDLREWISRGLSPQEQLLVLLYYFEELTMKDVGAALELSESRVGQMHASVLERLRARVAEFRRREDKGGDQGGG